MIHWRSTDRITVSGIPGTGKTTLVRYLGTMVEPEQLFIYDTLNQYEGFPDSCRYIPKTDSREEFDAVCRRLNARSNLVFIIEEAERYIREGVPLTENAFNLVNRGRNWGVGIVAVTRRIQRLNKDYFDLCRGVFFFKAGLKSRGYIAEMAGPEIARQVIYMPRFHFLYYDLDDETHAVGKLDLGGHPTIKEGTSETTRVGAGPVAANSVRQERPPDSPGPKGKGAQGPLFS